MNRTLQIILKNHQMGELKIEYSNKKVTPFGGMKLLKDFIDKTNVISNLKEVNLPQLGSNAGYNPVNIIQGFWLAIFTGTSRYIHADFFISLIWKRTLKSFHYYSINFFHNLMLVN